MTSRLSLPSGKSELRRTSKERFPRTRRYASMNVVVLLDVPRPPRSGGPAPVEGDNPMSTTAPQPDTATVGALPVVVIGAGPVGLAAAAHLVARGLRALVLEAGPDVGAAMSVWGHIRTFTPWQYIVDETAEKVLAPTGWTRPTE